MSSAKGQTNDDHLLKNVQDLRKRLQMTQRNLQQITAWESEPTRGREVTSESGKSSSRRFSSSTPLPSRVPPTPCLDDSAPDFLPGNRECPVPDYGHQRHMAAGAVTSDGTRTPSHRMSPVVHQTPQLNFSNNAGLSTIHSGVNSSAEFEHVDLRRKLYQLREANAGLVSDKHRLQTRIEDADYELARTECRIKELADQLSRAGQLQGKEVTSLRQRLDNLQAEAEIQDQTIRDAESRYEHAQRVLDSTRSEHKASLEEQDKLRQQVAEQEKVIDRISRERSDAVRSLDELKATFHEYQGRVKEKLKKLNSRDKALTEDLAQKEQHAVALRANLSSLEHELTDVREELSRHQAELAQTKDANEQYQQITADLRSLVDTQKEQIGKLQADLDHRKTNEADLRSMVAKQRERLEKYKDEVILNRNQLSQLELMAQKCGLQGFKRPSRPNSVGSDSGIISRPSSQSNRASPSHGSQSQRDNTSRDQSFGSDVISPDHSPRSGNAVVNELRFQLSVKEAEIASLRTAVSSQDENSNTTWSQDRNHATSRRVAELENQLARLEEERTNHKLRISQLETRVSDLDSELSSKSAMLRHRNNDLSELQNEISNKHTELMTAEKELRRKSSKLTTLEHQLEEKTNEQSDHVATLHHIRDELAHKTTTIGELRGQLDEKSHQLIEHKALSENIQLLHKQQCQEYERQIEMLQSKIESKCDDIKQAETVVISCKHELDQKVDELVSMELQLNHSKQALSQRQQKDQEALFELEELSSQSHKQLAHMEQALMVCRQEIQMYVDRLTEQEKSHHEQLEAKHKQLLELELRIGEVMTSHRTLVTSHGDLEQAYERQETMLAESTDRIHELEEAQAKLHKQLSAREKEAVQVQDKLREELDGVRNKLSQSLDELDERAADNQQLRNIVESLQSEKLRLESRISDLQTDCQQTTLDQTEKQTCITDLQDQLEAVSQEKEKKAQQVYDLEEQVHVQQAECERYKSRVKEVDEELQRLQVEVRTTHDTLSQLQKLLLVSQERVSEQTSEISSLQDTLRESQNELLQRSQVCEELDQALKDRTWELEQRVTQISHLDSTFKGRRDEADTQITRLEGLLAQRQMDLDHRVNEISELVVQVGELQRSAQNKELELQRREINEQHLAKIVEEKQCKISELEERSEKARLELDEMKMENRDLQQELRLAREQHQKEHAELVEAGKHWRTDKLEQDRMARELDETLSLVQTKDVDAARLAEELGTIRAQQSHLESRNSGDVRKLRHEIQQIRDQHQYQLSTLREDHAAILASKDQLVSQHRAQAAELQTTISDLKRRVEEGDRRNSELETEVHEHMNSLQDINQSVLLKENEIAQLRDQLDQCPPYPTDDTNRLSSLYSGHRPRSLSPRRFSDISKMTEYQDLPTVHHRLQNQQQDPRLDYLDIDDSRRLSFDKKFFDGGRDSTSTRLSMVSRRDSSNTITTNPRISGISSRRKSRSKRRESRSDFSGIFTASESEGEEDADSFVVMLREVNNRFTKIGIDNQEVKRLISAEEENAAEETVNDTASEETLKFETLSEKSGNETERTLTVMSAPVIRIPSGGNESQSP